MNDKHAQCPSELTLEFKMLALRFKLIATCFSALTCFVVLTALERKTSAQEPPEIRHSIPGGRRIHRIIDEEGREVWSTKGGAKDATRFSNGHILITYNEEVVEFNPAKKIVWRYKKEDADAELVSAWRIEDEKTLVVVLGDKPRLIEVDTAGEVVATIPLDPEQTDNQSHADAYGA